MLPTFKPGDITAIAGFKPRSFRERRTVVLLLTLVSLHDTSTGRIAPFNFTRKPRCQSKF